MTKQEFFQAFSKETEIPKHCSYCHEEVNRYLFISNDSGKSSNDIYASSNKTYTICPNCWENLDRETKKQIFRDLFRASAMVKSKCDCCKTKMLKWVEIGEGDNKFKLCPKCFANTGEVATILEDNADLMMNGEYYLIIDTNQANISFDHFNYYMSTYFNQYGIQYDFNNLYEYISQHGFYDVMNVTADHYGDIENSKAMFDSYGISSYILGAADYANYVAQINAQKPDAIYFADNTMKLN